MQFRCAIHSIINIFAQKLIAAASAICSIDCSLLGQIGESYNVGCRDKSIGYHLNYLHFEHVCNTSRINELALQYQLENERNHD